MEAALLLAALPTFAQSEAGMEWRYGATGGREFDDPDIVAIIKQLLKS